MAMARELVPRKVLVILSRISYPLKLEFWNTPDLRIGGRINRENDECRSRNYNRRNGTSGAFP